jgi:GNAT superfamily N-acetyltransferase
VNAILKHNNLATLSRIGGLSSNARMLTGDKIPGLALDEFYERMFPARAGFMKSHWRWLYQNPAGAQARLPIVVMEDNRVVGHISAIPLKLRRGRDERAAIWLCDLAVLPEYRGKSLGSVLLAEAMTLSSLRVGFPNELSWRLMSKCGWKDQSHTVGLSLLLRPEWHPRLRKRLANRRSVKTLAALAGLATRIIWRARTLSRKKLLVAPASDERLARFIERKPPAALHVARSSEFLDWRILKSPHAEEHFVMSSPNGGNAIARVVEDDGCRRLHLLALRGDPLSLSDFLAGVIGWALKEELHVISLVTSDPIVARVARRWLPVFRQLRYAYHADDLSGEEFMSRTGHIWEYLDGDFDLTYTRQIARK